MSNLSESLRNYGVTEKLQVVPTDKMEPIQELIYDLTYHLLPNHDSGLPAAERIKLPFQNVPLNEDWSKIMSTVNTSTEAEALLQSPEIIQLFEEILSSPVELFPISFFRAGFFGQARAIYNWHQDLGTWYVSGDRDLVEKQPVTLWLSLNGADRTNSLEIIPGSHNNRLEHHVYVKGQGRFSLRKAPALNSDVIVPECSPGQGVLFDQLTVHKTITNPSLSPRYSFDIRYYSPNQKASYNVAHSMKLLRLLQLFK